MSTIASKHDQKDIKPVPILIAFLIAGFIGLFSETALNMALGRLMIELDVVSSTVQWITTGYLLTMGVLIPVSALLIQWFSTRQLFVASLLFSILGAIVSGMAPIFEVLLLGRHHSGRWYRLINPADVQHSINHFPDSSKRHSDGADWAGIDVSTSDWTGHFGAHH